MCWHVSPRLSLAVLGALLWLAAPSDVLAQACYFGECQPDAPPAPRPPAPRQPAPAPAPSPERPGSSYEPVSGLPAFLQRNMCLAGNVALPVNDADTCARLYRDPGASRTDGQPADCAVLSPDGRGGVQMRIIPVSTVGQCWALRTAGGAPLHAGGRCATAHAGGFTHWRLDLSASECTDPGFPKLVVWR